MASRTRLLFFSSTKQLIGGPSSIHTGAAMNRHCLYIQPKFERSATQRQGQYRSKIFKSFALSFLRRRRRRICSAGPRFHSTYRFLLFPCYENRRLSARRWPVATSSSCLLSRYPFIESNSNLVDEECKRVIRKERKREREATSSVKVCSFRLLFVTLTALQMK